MGVLNHDATRDPTKAENLIKVKVPITLMDIRSDSGLEVFPVDTEHKFAVSISSYPEQVMT